MSMQVNLKTNIGMILLIFYLFLAKKLIVFTKRIIKHWTTLQDNQRQFVSCDNLQLLPSLSVLKRSFVCISKNISNQIIHNRTLNIEAGVCSISFLIPELPLKKGKTY